MNESCPATHRFQQSVVVDACGLDAWSTVPLLVKELQRCLFNLSVLLDVSHIVLCWCLKTCKMLTCDAGPRVTSLSPAFHLFPSSMITSRSYTLLCAC